MQQAISNSSLNSLIDADDDRDPNRTFPDAVIRDEFFKAAEEGEHNAHREDENEERTGDFENIADAGRGDKENDNGQTKHCGLIRDTLRERETIQSAVVAIIPDAVVKVAEMMAIDRTTMPP